jgi:predicted DNA-binding protein with PD1-like motif
MTWLADGQSLHQALVQVYAGLGARAGTFQLLGGHLAVAAYHVTGPQSASVRVAEYGPPTKIPGGATIVHATGSYGEAMTGLPMVHIHAAFADRTGRTHGGHVNPDLCIIGPGGVRAILMLAVGFKQTADKQTQFSLFFPFVESPSHGALVSS